MKDAMQVSSPNFDQLIDNNFQIIILKIMVIRRKLVTLHDHIMKSPKDASLPLNVWIFRSIQRLTCVKFDYCLQGCDVCMVQLLTIPTRNFHTHLEVGATRVLRNVGDKLSHYNAPHLKSLHRLPQVIK